VSIPDFDAMSGRQLCDWRDENANHSRMGTKNIKRADRFLSEQADHIMASMLYPAKGRYHDPYRNLELNGEIVIQPDRRPLNEETVAQLMTSIERVGIQSPPAVRFVEKMTIDGVEEHNVPVLIYGHHRLEAAKRLGWRWITCLVLDVNDVDAELTEISENLHRAELSVLQRDEQIARWIELTTVKSEDDVSRQPDAKPEKAKPGRPEGGVRSAARDLNISEPDARRAVKVAALSPEAKAAAVEAGLDDNRSALLEAAKETEPEKQVAALRERFEAGAAKAAAASAKALDKLRNRKVDAKPEPVGESDDEPDPETDEDGYYLKDEPVDQWRRNVKYRADLSIELPALWTREFAGWRKFAATPEMVQLAREAATMWGSLAVDLADRLASADQQAA
jgi:ParB-like chromosome segregation protein Spo0J